MRRCLKCLPPSQSTARLDVPLPLSAALVYDWFSGSRSDYNDSDPDVGWFSGQ